MSDQDPDNEYIIIPRNVVLIYNVNIYVKTRGPVIRETVKEAGC